MDARLANRVLNPTQPLIIGMIGLLMVGLIEAIAAIRNSGGNVLWLVIPPVVFGFLTFALAYVFQAAGWITMPARLRLGICSKCFKLVVQNREHCECGGTFEDADGWTPNSCPKCGYDLRGSASGRCPECDAEIVPFVMHDIPGDHQRPA